MRTSKLDPQSSPQVAELLQRPLRGLVVLLAVGLTLLPIAYADLTAGGDLGPGRLLAVPLNRLIAWADLNLQLSPRQGAERAVRLDPTLRSGLGRQGARWLATKGTLRERLRYGVKLAMRDPRDLPVLRKAVVSGLCSPDRRLRKAAVAAATSVGLTLRQAQGGRRRC
jgi:hypothetical protein